MKKIMFFVLALCGAMSLSGCIFPPGGPDGGPGGGHSHGQGPR